MNLLILVWSYVKARPLNTALNIVLLSLGTAVITLLILFSRQFEEKAVGNSKGIDLVIGAKGSPLQLILCNIFHIDFPTGNIPLAAAEKVARHRLIKKAIPLALGDSYLAYRIIGTPLDYPTLYNGTIDRGRWYEHPLEATIGSNVASGSHLNVGDMFSSAHGLTEGGHAHEEHHYKVVGIIKPTNSVIDNLILTSIESIWIMHEEHGEDNHDEGHALHVIDPSKASRLVPSVEAGDSTKQITSLLVQYRSAMGAVQLPRIVNAETSLQAASPAFETARLFSIMGTGVDVLLVFGYVLVFISALSIFIALYNSLKERRYDMAILRSMGASRKKLVISILWEGTLLTIAGCALGLFLGHSAMAMLSIFVASISKAGFDGFIWYREEWIILAGALLLGMLSALVPAIQAYKIDISKVLSSNG